MKKDQVPVPPKTGQCCSLPAMPVRTFSPDVDSRRASIILATSLKWVNGSVLKYYFFSTEQPAWNGSAKQEQVVRKAFEAWKNVGIGIGFEEVKSAEDADIRIGFLVDDGSWSFIGRTIWEIPKNERTMNFGWDISRSADGLDTAIHEIGHTLGFHHEHQNPNAGIVWDEEAVYADLAQPPNKWPRDKTFNNIIRKLNPNDVQGSNWDPNSIMHYPFGPGLILQPAEFRSGLAPAGGLSAKDKEQVRFFYPPAKEHKAAPIAALQAAELSAGSGGQQDFLFKPKSSKKYKIQTFGNLDTLLVLFEEDANGEQHFLGGDDDSGTDDNALLRLRLIKGRKYVIRVRVIFRGSDGSGGVVIS